MSLAAALSSVIHDDVGGGGVFGACTVTACVATGVTGTGVTGVACVHVSPVDTDMPSAASLALADAAWLVVKDNVCGGFGDGCCAHESPVATDTCSFASLLVAGAVCLVVGDDVGGGFVVGANDIIKSVATGVTGVAWVHESPVDVNKLSAASLSLAAAVW